MSTPAAQDGGRKHTAGASDVRVFIAGLIGFYGVVLVLVGIFGDTAADRAKTGGVNANLWAGLVMILVAIAFAVWIRLRPIVIDQRAVAEARAAAEEDQPAS